MDGELERLATILARRMTRHQKKLAVAESCTGGLLSSTLTDLSGASSWFERGWVVYSNTSKFEELGVSPTLIEEHGAVSVEVAEAMVNGVMATKDIDWGIAITGVAGPVLDESMKPIGTVCIAVANRKRAVIRQREFGGDRAANKRFFAHLAIQMIIETWDAYIAEEEE